MSQRHPHEPPHFPERHDSGSRYATAQRVTWVSVAVNLVLTLMQIIGGTLVHAQSLVADGFHSLSDLVADILVILANRQSQHPADEDHPYGHERIETVASLALGILLVVTGGAILWTASSRLQHLDDLPPIHATAVWIAVFTLVAKECLFRYMLKIAEALRSPMLIANAWHARADAASSLVVTAGIIGSLLGWRFLDPVAAIIVGLMILRMGFRFSWEALAELIDTAIPAEEQAALRKTIRETPGVLAAHELRTRRMAHKVLVDAHVQVAPRISASEGHRIAEDVRLRVIADHEDILDVLVHIDVNNDSAMDDLAPQPDRDVALRQLCDLTGLQISNEQLTLHYLDQGLEAEIILPEGVTLNLPPLASDSPFARITLFTQSGQSLNAPFNGPR